MIILSYSEYRSKSDKSQNTMIASVLQTVSIIAEKDGRTETLWENRMVNSWMSVVPIKYEMHDESIGTVQLLGNVGWWRLLWDDGYCEGCNID